MPTAQLDVYGTQFYYEDSGALDTSYTTIVIVHGTGVHGAIFRPIIPYAKAHNLRIVLLNRRDYPGSTPLTDADLAELTAAPEKFMRARAIEIAEFLAWFVRTHSIPRISSKGGKRVGGLAVVGWSSANAFMMGLFGNIDSIPQATRDTLDPYLRTYVHFDGPRWPLGLRTDELVSLPPQLLDTTASEDERFAFYKTWISTYYQHPYLTAPFYTRCAASDLTDGIPENRPLDAIPTFDRMTPEDQDATTSRYALFHSEILVRVADPQVLADNLQRTLYHGGKGSSGWDGMTVVFLHCMESMWEMISASWTVEAWYSARQMGGDVPKGRNLEFRQMQGANHLPMWDQPEKLMKELAELV
ncbi:hypothetical protein BV25DRAFT_1835280 [Artomyces pyxidatus]|uniref:Uncharacterized protein n=1 Tax=Artomyces pyxidatus TaxID=48021 RepID=A0ACB8TEU8_9AGAM|nr:hypothetical protein BV25DRAFT_1835280 [Artomyces pyxidatus]